MMAKSSKSTHIVQSSTCRATVAYGTTVAIGTLHRILINRNLAAEPVKLPPQLEKNANRDGIFAWCERQPVPKTGDSRTAPPVPKQLSCPGAQLDSGYGGNKTG